MSHYKKEFVRKLEKDLQFEQGLRHWEGYELHSPSEREFELEDKIAAALNFMRGI